MLLFIPKSGAELRVVADLDEARAWMKRVGYTARVVEISEGQTHSIPKPPPVNVHGQAAPAAPVVSAADFAKLLAQNQALVAELQAQRAERALAAPKAPDAK